MSTLSKWICAALMAGLPGLGQAGFRCMSGKLASEGDTKAEVQINCGRPFATDYIGLVKIDGTYVHLDRWTYRLGDGKLLKLLEFHDGVLVDVKDGKRS